MNVAKELLRIEVINSYLLIELLKKQKFIHEIQAVVQYATLFSHMHD